MGTQARDPVGITRTTFIDAPLEEVFAYYAEPANLPEIWPSLLEVSDVEHDEAGHPTRFRWVYKMAGMRFKGETVNTVFEPNRRYVSRSEGGISSTIEVLFADKGGRTEVTDRVTYTVPVPLLGRVAQRFLERLNENELETIHANLKARMESGS